MRRMRLYSTHVVTLASGDKYSLIIGLLLLTGYLYATPYQLPVNPTLSYFSTAGSQITLEPNQACVTTNDASQHNHPDGILFENADEQSLKKYAEGSSLSLTAFIDATIPLTSYFYSPAPCRYVIFSVFRV